MLSQSILENTISQEKSLHQRNAQSFDGEFIAKVFKYYRSLQNPYKSKSFPMKLVSGKALYDKHKQLFDKFAEIASKNGFDAESYLKYCVKCGMTENTLHTCLASTKMIDKYLMHLKKVDFRKKIYRWFIKSAKNIAIKCVDDGYFTTKDFLRMLIDTKQIGRYIVTGQISVYFFAAIPNFKRAIPKLDYFSRQELQLLDEHFEIYHSDVNKAFLQEKNCYVNPIDFTDKIIWKIRNKR